MMDDSISRQAAIGAISSMFAPTPTQKDMVEDCLEIIENLPSAQPERKKGKWILVHEADETGNATYECSICHRGEVHVPIVDVSFCWNCGADMRGTDE